MRSTAMRICILGTLLVTALASQLPPEIQMDRYLLQAERAIEREDFASAREALDKINLLGAASELELPEAFFFWSALVEWQTGRPAQAVQSVTRYLSLAGRDGKFYDEALELLDIAEEDSFSTERTCEGKPQRTACWMELASHPQCYVWVQLYAPDMTLTWTGECTEELASGTGTLKRVSEDYGLESTGLLRAGREHGQWELRDAKGNVSEGPYEYGKRHGQWVFRFASGGVWEGPYVHDKKHGQWVDRYADGTVEEGPYEDGKKNGQWVIRTGDGSVFEGPYVDDKRHGHWVEDYAGGSLQEGPYVNGKMHGRWVSKTPSGLEYTLNWVNGRLE